MAPPSCSLVIPTRSRSDDLRRCLAAVVQLMPRPDEIIVVDNSAGHPATARVARDFGADYVVESVAGTSRARNAGARHAGGEVVAFLDDDMVPREGWLAALLEPFGDESVVASTGRVLPLPAGSGERLDGARSLDLGPDRQVFDRSSPRWFEMTNFGGVGFGMIMAIRRSAFERWPGFHPMVGRGTSVPAGEDNFAFFELIKMGGRITYCPDAVAFNGEPSTRAAHRVDPVARVSDAAAYATLLVAEVPGARWRTVRYAVGGLMGRSRPWRIAPESPNLAKPNTWQLAWGLVRGTALYLQARAKVAGSSDRRWERAWVNRTSAH